MNLTPHFTLEELIASEVGARLGIDNMPSTLILKNLNRLAEGLERVRETLGNLPIHINSGFRCAQLNQAVRGAKDSMHLKGLAADIVVPNFGTPLMVCRALANANLGTDQIIHEFGLWCHVAFPEEGQAPRNSLLTIARISSGYEEGLLSV